MYLFVFLFCFLVSSGCYYSPGTFEWTNSGDNIYSMRIERKKKAVKIDIYGKIEMPGYSDLVYFKCESDSFETYQQNIYISCKNSFLGSRDLEKFPDSILEIDEWEKGVLPANFYLKVDDDCGIVGTYVSNMNLGNSNECKLEFRGQPGGLSCDDFMGVMEVMRIE